MIYNVAASRRLELLRMDLFVVVKALSLCHARLSKNMTLLDRVSSVAREVISIKI